MNIKNLALALSKAQSEIKAPLKNRTVDFTYEGKRTKYSYADLADVIDCLRLPLSKNELSIAHKLTYEFDQYGLKTILMHSSGEFIDTWHPLPDPSKVKPQSFGSSLTYARRYSISSIVGIASEEDDDGQTAEAPPQKPKPIPQNKPLNPHNPQTSPQKEESPIDRVFELTPLDQLVGFAKDFEIPHQDMATAITRATGTHKKSKDLTNDEIEKTLKYLHMKYKK
jgi:hypothetical protein